MYIYIYYKRQENLLFIINLEKKIYIYLINKILVCSKYIIYT